MTNKNGLPEPIVRAVSIDNHRTLGEISTTQLIDSPQIRMLKKKHRVEPDASELIFALLGTATHSILQLANTPLVRERAFDMTIETLEQQGFKDVAASLAVTKPKIFHKSEDDRYLYEITLSQEVNGMQLSSTFDLYDKVEKKLYDYKVCSVWNYVYPEAKAKWFGQLNIYAYMLRLEGYEVNSASVIAIFRDFSQAKVALNQDYPKSMAMELDIPLYPEEKMSKYLSERVRLHRAAENGEPIECTGRERWASSDTFAVMAEGSKRAVRVLSNENDANNLMNDIKHKYKKCWVEKRIGENKRCASFCAVSQVCPQYKAILNSNNQ